MKPIKLVVLRTARSLGSFALLAQSGWRRQRLLILCYHGVSLTDEHLWNPRLYVSPQFFRERLELLHGGGYAVLPLGEAITRLYRGTLPPRAVVLTFDDGHYDFLPAAHPILQDYGYPATVYLTTYHSDCNVPIFGLICSYMLWQARERVIDLAPLTGGPSVVLGESSDRARALALLVSYAREQQLSAMEKHALAGRVATRLAIDFDDICARRVLHLLNPDEVRQLAGRGVDFQMHTHCHRSPRIEGPYREQVSRNRERIEELTGRSPQHFCYPSGETAPAFLPWLSAEGVRSAVTCEHALATRAQHPLLLPRLLDHSGLTAIEFQGWLCGFSALLPHRAQRPYDSRTAADAGNEPAAVPAPQA